MSKTVILQNQSHHGLSDQGQRHALDPRVWATLLALYIAQAIPVYLIAAALPPIFRARGIDLVSIGSIGILMLPWILKFLWAPFIDRTGSHKFGKRRSWILPMQLISVAAIFYLSTLTPEDNLSIFFPVLMLVALCAATQDIATDGYAVEHLSPPHQALGNAIQGGSVAAGVLIGGSLTLFVYDLHGWTIALQGAAGLSLLCLLPLLLFSEDIGKRQDLGLQTEKATTGHTQPSLKAFFKRRYALALLAFAIIFRLPEGLIKGVEQAFMVDQGLSLSQIGLVSGGAAACVGLGGSALAVLFIKAYGLRAFFWVIGISRSVCFAGYAAFSLGWFNTLSNNTDLLFYILVSLSAFNTLIRYMEIVGLYSAFMRFASLSQAGTDFTFLSCANLLVYMLGSITAGTIAHMLGYSPLFALAFGLSVISIMLAMIWLPDSLIQNKPQSSNPQTPLAA